MRKTRSSMQQNVRLCLSRSTTYTLPFQIMCMLMVIIIYFCLSFLSEWHGGLR